MRRIIIWCCESSIMTKNKSVSANAVSPVKAVADQGKIVRSPGKANKMVPTRVKKQPLTIYALGFGDPFTFELYYFEKNGTEDGFTHGITKYMRGSKEDVHELFDTANFTQVLSRRIPQSNDIVMKNAGNNYDRTLFLRYPPDGDSTAATRATGLMAMKAFLMDARFSRYPPTTIATVDVSDYDSKLPTSMDSFMMNADIQAVLLQDLDSSLLNESFKSDFPDHAKIIWSGANVGDFGRSLGF